MAPTKERPATKTIATNREARHEYFVLEALETGVELKGTEVKSLRAGGVNLKDSWVDIEDGELLVKGMHITPYDHGNIFNQDPLRVRRLLAHKNEIRRLHQQCKLQGYTLVPLSLYFKHGRVKMELGLCKGKKLYDKRDDAAKKDGCILTPYAGYCSVSRQNDNYNRKVNYYKNQGLSDDDAAAKARTFILPGGYSEQNLGLSMDIVSASSDFASTKEFSWLVKNAQDYGFILRYPENKTDKTGMNYQPWHWRYVGKEAAKAMNKSGLCLEEYLKAA